MPTSNPVPSDDPSDLVFNAEKLDEVVNSTDPTFTDRLGNVRKTVAGVTVDIESAAASWNNTVFASTAAGLAATSNGDYFSVPSSDSYEFLILYLNSAGSAVEQKRYPSTQAISLVPNQPFRREDYGPSKLFPIKDINAATALTIDSTANRLTLGATTGTVTLVSSASSSMTFTPSENIIIWFEAITGAPTTFTYRFLTSAGAGIGTSTALGKFGNFYFVAVEVPATAANLTLTIANSGGSAIVFTRPSVAWRKTSHKDGNQEPTVTALRNIMAQSDSDEQGNLWETNSVAKVSGAGTSPTLNADGTVTCPPNAIHYARSDLSVSEGDTHTWMVKVAEANLDLKYLYVRYVGATTELMRLQNVGNGWWIKVGHVVGSLTPGVGTTFYVRVELENTTSSYYTAADVTIEAIYLIEGSNLPNQLPGGAAAGGTYDKTEVVVQQSSGGIDVFTPGTNPATSKYVRWQLREYSGAAGSGAGWTMELLHETSRTGDDSFTVGNQLTDLGEHLLAVREQGKLHMGGDTHGYQIASSELLFVDGSKKTIDGTTSYRGRRVEFIMASQLIDTTDGLTPKFDVVTNIIFDGEGMILRHKLTALAAMTISSMYMAMLSMSRWINHVSANGEQFDNVYWAPDYTEATTSVQADVENDGHRYIISGDQGITVDIEVLEGWDHASRESFVQRATNSVKVYFSPRGIVQAATSGVAVSNGEEIEMVTRYRVNTAN